MPGAGGSNKIAFETKQKLGQFRIIDWWLGCLEGRTLVGLALLSTSLKQDTDNQMIPTFRISTFNFFKTGYHIFTSAYAVIIMAVLPADEMGVGSSKQMGVKGADQIGWTCWRRLRIGP